MFETVYEIGFLPEPAVQLMAFASLLGIAILAARKRLAALIVGDKLGALTAPMVRWGLLIWGWGTLLGFASGGVYYGAQHYQARAAYLAGEVLVSEGPVVIVYDSSVEREAADDLFEIGGERFLLRLFALEPGYHTTRGQGGALQEGVFARVASFEGQLLKVEVRAEAPTAEPEGSQAASSTD